MIRSSFERKGLKNGRWRNELLQTDKQLNRMNVKNIICNQKQVVASHLPFEQVKMVRENGEKNVSGIPEEES